MITTSLTVTYCEYAHMLYGGTEGRATTIKMVHPISHKRETYRMGINTPPGKDAAVIKYMPTVQKEWGTDNVHSKADSVACIELHEHRLYTATREIMYVQRRRPGRSAR